MSSKQTTAHLAAEIPQFDGDCSLCDLAHVETHSGDHILMESPGSDDIHQGCFSSILQPNKRQLHLLLEEQAAYSSNARFQLNVRLQLKSKGSWKDRLATALRTNQREQVYFYEITFRCTELQSFKARDFCARQHNKKNSYVPASQLTQENAYTHLRSQSSRPCHHEAIITVDGASVSRQQ